MSTNESVEKYIDELKIITEKMKQQDIPLEESVELFQQGQALADKAMSLLKEYKNKIEILNEERLMDFDD